MSGRWRVVVVSKHLEVWQKISSILRDQWGMEVICCSTVAEAREFLQRDIPELVFCDNRLSDGSYGDLLERARVHDAVRQIRLVVMPGLEAFPDPDFESNAWQRGAYSVLGPTVEVVDIERVAIRAIREDAMKRAPERVACVSMP